MLYEEFLSIANLTKDDITVWTYENLVEPMYMAAPDSMDRQAFVKLINLKTLITEYPNRNNTIRKIEKVAAECRELYGHTTLHTQEHELQELINELAHFDRADSAQMTIYGDRGYTMSAILIHVIKWTDDRHNAISWEYVYRIDATKKKIKLKRYEY